MSSDTDDPSRDHLRGRARLTDPQAALLADARGVPRPFQHDLSMPHDVRHSDRNTLGCPPGCPARQRADRLAFSHGGSSDRAGVLLWTSFMAAPDVFTAECLNGWVAGPRPVLLARTGDYTAFQGDVRVLSARNLGGGYVGLLLLASFAAGEWLLEAVTGACSVGFRVDKSERVSPGARRITEARLLAVGPPAFAPAVPAVPDEPEPAASPAVGEVPHEAICPNPLPGDGDPDQCRCLRSLVLDARSWARHGYEIGQRSCTWSDAGVAPRWLTDPEPGAPPVPAPPVVADPVGFVRATWDGLGDADLGVCRFADGLPHDLGHRHGRAGFVRTGPDGIEVDSCPSACPAFAEWTYRRLAALPYPVAITPSAESVITIGDGAVQGLAVGSRGFPVRPAGQPATGADEAGAVRDYPEGARPTPALDRLLSATAGRDVRAYVEPEGGSAGPVPGEAMIAAEAYEEREREGGLAVNAVLDVLTNHGGFTVSNEHLVDEGDGDLADRLRHALAHRSAGPPGATGAVSCPSCGTGVGEPNEHWSGETELHAGLWWCSRPDLEDEIDRLRDERQRLRDERRRLRFALRDVRVAVAKARAALTPHDALAVGGCLSPQEGSDG